MREECFRKATIFCSVALLYFSLRFLYKDALLSLNSSLEALSSPFSPPSFFFLGLLVILRNVLATAIILLVAVFEPHPSTELEPSSLVTHGTVAFGAHRERGSGDALGRLNKRVAPPRRVD
mmetsp:Transcript_17921/g.35395  ORF Transcript_17921/g.35395 Transcript_17921/m.35395 type:complete len:121 (+) Transcript_17921:794-1156(+)